MTTRSNRTRTRNSSALAGAGLALLLGALTLVARGAFAAGPRLAEVRAPVLPAGGGPPPTAASYVELEIALPLAPLRDALDHALPRELRRAAQVDTTAADDSDQEREPGEENEASVREWLGRPVRWRGLLRREPVALRARGDSLSATTAFSYSVEVLDRGLEEARCGSVAQPWTGTAVFGSLLGWSDAWTLETRERRGPISYATRCKPEPPGINFTHRINDRVTEGLANVLPARLDSVVRARTDLSGRVRAALDLLSRPVMVGDSTAWLRWNVGRVLVDPPRGSGDSILVRLAFEAHPEIADRPGSSASPAAGEPRVRVSGFEIRIPFDCWVDYTELADGMLGLAAARSGGGDSLRVAAARVMGGGDRLAVALELGGAVQGTAWLTGRLTALERPYVVQCADLEWTAESRAALRAAAGVNGWPALESALKRLRDAVRNRVSRPLQDCVVTWDGAINGALQPDPAGALALQGGLYRREVQTVFCTDRAVGVRLIAVGRAHLTARR
jgi:hypothetical protein